MVAASSFEVGVSDSLLDKASSVLGPKLTIEDTDPFSLSVLKRRLETVTGTNSNCSVGFNRSDSLKSFFMKLIRS